MKETSTQATIARRLKLDRSTVSLCFTRPEKVGNETRRRILDTAQRLGYRPNSAAQAVRGGKFGAIGVLMSTVSHRSVLTHSINGIQQGVSDANMAVRFCHVADEDLSDDSYLRQLTGNLAVDGLLINYTFDFPPALLSILEKYRIPSIWMNVKQDHDCVHTDDYRAGVIGVEHLLHLGHRRIGYATFTAQHNHYSVHDRHAGYVAAIERAGLTPSVVEWDRHENNAQRDRLIADWLSGPDRPTAVFCHSTAEANCVYIAARGHGLSVPRDLSILTPVDGSAGFPGPEYDAVDLPTQKVGRRAVELLQKKIARPSRPLPTEAIPPTLNVQHGRSTAPPKNMN